MRSLCMSFLLFVILTFVAPKANAEDFKLAILHGDPEVFSYEISVVDMALAHADGDHRLQLIYLPNTNQVRILKMLAQGNLINIFFTGYDRERENRFLQVNIPLTRGLLGHRVFIKKKSTDVSDQVTSIEDIQKLRVGSGIGWPDTDIFKAAGFKVVASTYENLWPMLDKERYELFNRGLQEAFVEVEQQALKGYEFEVDPNLMVSYPYDYFLYVNKKSTHLHAILEQGLKRAYETGAFMENFNNHPAIQQAIKEGRPTERTHFRIANPHLSERARAIPAHYWHQF